MIKKTIQYIDIFTITFSFSAHIVAFLKFLLLWETFSLPQHFLYQITAMLILSFTGSLLVFLIPQHKNLLFPTWVIKFIVIFIIGYPLGNYIDIELSLLMALTMELNIYISHWASIPLSIVIIATILFSQSTIYAWGKEVRKVEMDGLLTLFYYPVASLLLGRLLQFYSRTVSDRSRLIANLNKSSIRLIETNIELQDYVTMREQQTVLLERKKVSREIHDIVGHCLVSIALMMKASLQIVGKDDKQLVNFLRQAHQRAQDGLSEIRKVLTILRTPTKPKITLISLINKLVEAFDNTHVNVHVRYNNIPWSFSESVDHIINRVVQEGITNSLKHGGATDIIISFWVYNKDTIHITIEDNGTGSDDITEGVGLKGMRERLEPCGGKIEASNIQTGFLLHVYLPLHFCKSDEKKVSKTCGTLGVCRKTV